MRHTTTTRAIVVLAAMASAAVLIAAAPEPSGLNVYAVQNPPPPPQSQAEVSVILTNPGSHPKIGFQPFSSASPALAEAATTVVDVLAADLEYEREFYVIARKTTAGIPAAATPQALPFPQWTDIGADFVMMGSLRETGGAVTVEVKLIHVKAPAAGKEGFGQSYAGCAVANIRYCAHAIADDMHRQLRNLDGVARTRVAFTSDRDGDASTDRPIENAPLGKEIHLMDYDGASDRRITFNHRLNLAPSWGPDGRTLAYASYATDYPDIYLTMLDGRAPTRPAQGTTVIHNQNAAISPDGSKIAFTTNRGSTSGNYDIWIVNRDGSNLHNATPGTDKSSEGAATWSPDGARLAFTSDRTGTNQIFMMSADGTNVERKTFSTKADRPAWSKLGYIAYTLERNGGHDVAVLDLARGESRVLTDGVGSCRQPTVAPNGRHIAFVTTRWGGKEQIATIDYPDGKNIRQLTTKGNNTYPNWSPTPGGK